MKPIYILSLMLVFVYKISSAQEKQTSDSETAILFIGNSLTYTNNLPELVRKKAKIIGEKVKVKTVAFPNYAIEDHWKDGKVQQLIKSKKFQYVIIQQGPSSQLDGKKMLIDYGKKFSEICQQNNAKLCFFMVWPSLQYYHTFKGVIDNYSKAATENNAIILPVGKIWKQHFDNTNNFDFYGPDGFHPSLKGSNMAAEVIVNSLF